MITGFAPSLSSSAPTAIVEMPATTFAAIAKMITSPAENPKTDAASTPPKVNTPASPSRKTALASRNQTVCRDSRQSLRDVAAQALVRGEEAHLLALRARCRGTRARRTARAARTAPNQIAETIIATRIGRPSSSGTPNRPCDEAEVHDQQQHDAADVAHAPAEAADPADRARGGDLREHRVVVDPGELEEDVAGRHEDEPEAAGRRGRAARRTSPPSARRRCRC